MFETAEVGRRVGKKELDTEEPKLGLELLEAQRALQAAGVPLIVLLAGADGAGKGKTVSRLLEWLDTRRELPRLLQGRPVHGHERRRDGPG